MSESGRLYRPALRPPSGEPQIDPGTLDWRGGLLVRSTNWLGDVLMTLPAIHRLTTVVPPGTPIMALAPRKLAQLWESVPWVSKVVPFAGKRLTPEERAAVKALAPGLTVILPNSFGSAWDLWRAGVPMRLGRAGRGRKAMLDFPLPPWQRKAGRDQYHQVCEYLDLVHACGAQADELSPPPLRPALGDADREAVATWLAGDKPVLAIAPGAAYGPAKQWPAESFAETAAWWCRDRGGRVIAVGAPGEEESAAAALSGCPDGLNLAGKSNLMQLMAVLARAACVVANDSGAMHLAAALGRPGVGIFGSTDPVATGPLGGRWVVLRKELPCSPCLARTCARTDVPYECLQVITPEMVRQAIAMLLDGEGA